MVEHRRRRRAGLPVATTLVGAVFGVVVAWFGNEIRAFHRQQRYVRCVWCNDYLTDMTDPQHRSKLVLHISRCTSFPLPAMARLAANSAVFPERLAS